MYQVDTLGRDVQKYVWENGDFLRMEGTTFALSTRLSGGQKGGGDASKDRSQAQDEYVNENKDRLVDLTIPWTLDLNYNLRLSKSWNSETLQFDSRYVQSATFRGSFSVMQKVSVNFDSGYEFETKKLTTTTIGATVDLHCWEFSATWVPFGLRKSYMFQLNIKSQMLKDLKLQKRGNYGDLLY
jgi:hypothetical protein